MSYGQEWRAKRKARGLCIQCGESARQTTPGGLCERCAEKRRKRSRELRMEREGGHICVSCGQARGENGTPRLCGNCAEKRRRSSREYYFRNWEKARARNRAWVRAHREPDRKRSREWRKVNRGYGKQALRAWRRLNPARAKAIASRDYGRRTNARGSCDAEQLTARIEYYGGLCCIPGCGKSYEHIDHAIPLSANGTQWPANLRPMCAKHNLMKGAKHLVEFIQMLGEDGEFNPCFGTMVKQREPEFWEGR